MKLDNSIRGSPGLCGGGLWWCLRIELDTRVFLACAFYFIFYSWGFCENLYEWDTEEFWGSTNCTVTSSVPGVVPVWLVIRVEIQMGIWARGCSNRRAGMAKKKR